MKTNKTAKPVSQSTIGDLTDAKCGFCGLNLIFVEADLEEKVGWLSCPTYIGERKFYKEEHSSYSVPLTETGYQAGDEAKSHRALKEPRETGRLHHNRINMTAPPKAKEGDFKFSSADERKRRP